MKKRHEKDNELVATLEEKLEAVSKELRVVKEELAYLKHKPLVK